MEEKKKRWRPSLTAYREMQRQVEEALVLLKDARKELVSGKAFVDKMKAENEALMRSNSMMEKELSLQREMNDELNRLNEKLRDELFDLKNRGFWARVLNKY